MLFALDGLSVTVTMIIVAICIWISICEIRLWICKRNRQTSLSELVDVNPHRGGNIDRDRFAWMMSQNREVVTKDLKKIATLYGFDNSHMVNTMVVRSVSRRSFNDLSWRMLDGMHRFLRSCRYSYDILKRHCIRKKVRKALSILTNSMIRRAGLRHSNYSIIKHIHLSGGNCNGEEDDAANHGRKIVGNSWSNALCHQ